MRVPARLYLDTANKVRSAVHQSLQESVEPRVEILTQGPRQRTPLSVKENTTLHPKTFQQGIRMLLLFDLDKASPRRKNVRAPEHFGTLMSH